MSKDTDGVNFVTDDNTGGYYVCECQNCGEVFSSRDCGGGGQIADTGDYDDAYCPHCDQVDPLECENPALVWNVQQKKINDLLAAQEDHQRLVRQLDRLLNGEAGAAQQASLCDLVAQVDNFLRDDYGNRHSAALLGLKISIPTDAMEQEIASSVRRATEKLKTKSDMLLAALHGVAETLDELSQEQSVSRLQGGAVGTASGIRLSIIKILGGAS